MAPGQAISLYFPHSSWSKHPGDYSSDIRGTYEALGIEKIAMLGQEMEYEVLTNGELWGHVWCFDVAKSYTKATAGDEVVIEFDGVESVPSEAGVYLIDKRLNRMIDVRKEGRFGFYLGERKSVGSEDEARFVLLVGSEEFVGKQELPGLPVVTALHQNYPNPFNPATLIRYDVAQPGHVELEVYDVRGALVKVLFSGHREPGRYEAGWNGESGTGVRVASGIYFCKLKVGDYSKTRKLLLLK
jgi:hypothetical protein